MSQPNMITKLALPIISLIMMGGLTACQKQEQNSPQQTKAQTSEVSHNTPAPSSSNHTLEQEHQKSPTQAQQQNDKPETDHTHTSDLAPSPEDQHPTDIIQVSASQTPTPQNAQPDAEQAVIGEQITEVTYVSENHQTMSVIFETSASGSLDAKVTLPDGKKVSLTAPQDQGNNPIYRSKDGKIELVSHAGGGSIDLINQGNRTSFNATSAEAEVIIK